MGFLDKVKAVATDAATAAKKGTAQIQGKLEVGQLRKKADESAKQLGYLIVRERTDGTPAGGEADRLVAEIVALEAQIEAEQAETAAKVEGVADDAEGEVAEGSAAPGSTPPVTPPPTSASETQAGDFTLD